jgi:predicted Zn-dependent protease
VKFLLIRKFGIAIRMHGDGQKPNDYMYRYQTQGIEPEAFATLRSMNVSQYFAEQTNRRIELAF